MKTMSKSAPKPMGKPIMPMPKGMPPKGMPPKGMMPKSGGGKKHGR